MINTLIRLRFLLYIFLITLVIGGGIVSKQKKDDEINPSIFADIIQPLRSFGDLVLGIHTERYEFALSAWIPEWDWDDGIEAFSKNAKTFSQINPIWYHIDEKGNLDPTKYAGTKKLQNLSARHNVLFIPTIQEFDADYLHEVLKSKTSTKKHAEEIIDIVDRYDLDGIDLDYEMIYLKDKDNFYLLLDLLSTALHKRYKILVIDVISKTGDDLDKYDSLVETRQVQDWSVLAEYVDEIRIMAYDYNNSNPDGSPINPYPWLEEVVSYAITKAHPQKFVLGTPLYAYSWKNRKLFKSYTYEVIKEGIEKRDVTPVFNTEFKEWRVILADTGEGDEEESDVLGESDEESTEGAQIVWYQDVTSFKHRLNLVKQYNLKGLALWRLGGEDERIYKLF